MIFGRHRPASSILQNLIFSTHSCLGVASTLAVRCFYVITVFMARQSVITQKKRGPPATGKGVLIGVRLQPPNLAALDAWIMDQPGSPSRPEAIRRLVEQALASKGAPRPLSKEAARKASMMAAREIESLGDTSLPVVEQQQRKRRLIRGPKEFRDMRSDQPKRKG
jgi:hypothetical protein